MNTWSWIRNLFRIRAAPSEHDDVVQPRRKEQARWHRTFAQRDTRPDPTPPSWHLADLDSSP